MRTTLSTLADLARTHALAALPLVALALGTSPAHAGESADAPAPADFAPTDLARLSAALVALEAPLAAAPLTLDMSSALTHDASAPPPPTAGGAASSGATPASASAPKADSPIAAKAEHTYGLPDGTWWITLGTGYAHNLRKDSDYNVHIAASTFLAKELEFSIELAGWYFAQEGPDTGGINPNMVFRWHFWHADDFKWTVYGDVGIGLLFAFDDVPSGGTSFDFTPRAGVGYTTKIFDDDTRLQIGVRYHHISNARIRGDDRNPSRDSVMIYAGIIFPY